MEVNIEEMVKQQLVSDVLAKVSDTDRNAILEKSMTKVLNEVFNTWQVEKAIKADAEKYMEEYIKTPDVQKRIKSNVITAFDNILVGMVAAFETKIEDTLHSKYVSFNKK